MSMPAHALSQAPAVQASRWLNSPNSVRLDDLRGRVVVLHAFQMLCPGCVALALPQMQRVRDAYPVADVAVLGLHTVFEHHGVMGAEALEVFLHEYGVHYPVGIDAHAEGEALPLTMQAYGFRGTPSLVLIDREGRLRLNHFGHLDDLRLGTVLGQLLAEGARVV